MLTTPREPSLVATPDALDSVAEWVAAAPVIAVDTEFVREKTYYPKLCLIQLATDDRATCIDCLAPLDLRSLLVPLFATDKIWVLHSARQDLEVIWYLTQRLPSRLIDTQIAAALIGYAPQIGLEGLLAKTLGVELGESYARTDWSRRPLPDPALEYALDDVRYLLPAWRGLERRLTELGRIDWFHEDARRLLADPPVADATTVWSRLKTVHALSLRERCAALALVRWREHEAQRKDRPRRWILPDDQLLAVATAMPSDRSSLERLVPPRLADKYGEALLGAVAAHTEPELQALVRANAALPGADKTALKALQAAVRQRAGELGMEPEILATRRDLAAVASGNVPEPLAQGWRADALADLLAAVPARPASN